MQMARRPLFVLWLLRTALAVGLGLCAAGARADDAVKAAFEACNGQPDTLEQRLQALSLAGWTLADDSPELRALYGEIAATGIPFVFTNGHGPETFATTRSGPFSGLTYRKADKVEQMPLPAGPIADLPTLLRTMAQDNAHGFFQMVAPGALGLLHLSAWPPSQRGGGYLVTCDLFLGAALTRDKVDALMPAEVSPKSLSRDHKTYGLKVYTVSYSTMAGYAGNVTYTDTTDLAPLKAWAARSGDLPPLSSVLTFESRNVLLSNTLSQ